MLQGVIAFIVKFIFECMVFLFMLRFILQIYKAPYFHPMILLLTNVTDRFVLPARRLLPVTVKRDYACILLAVCTLLIKYAFLSLVYRQIASPIWIFLSVFLDIIRVIISIYIYALILYALASWLPLKNNPSSPFTVIKLIANSCLSLLRPVVWKNFDLRIIILIGIGSILSMICNLFIIF